MPDNKRNVLDRVAAGELSPEEALALLEHAAAPSAAVNPDTPLRVVIEADLGAVTVTADPNVRDAVAVGGHTIKRGAGEVRIEGAQGRGVLSDGRLLPRRGRKHALRVRMNPDLPLDVRLGAGSMHAEGLRGPLDIKVDLGTATLEDVTGPFDVRVDSGTVSVTGAVGAGTSRVACDLGTVSVRLARTSDVTVAASTDAGRITLPGRKGPAIVFGASAEAVVGSGAGRLELHAAAGTIAVTVDR